MRQFGLITVLNEVAKVIFSQASVCPRGGGVSAPAGAWSGGCLLLGDVCSRGVSAPGGVSAPRGGLIPRGGAWSGGLASHHALRQTPPPRERQLLECILVVHESGLFNQ